MIKLFLLEHGACEMKLQMLFDIDAGQQLSSQLMQSRSASNDVRQLHGKKWVEVEVEGC